MANGGFYGVKYSKVVQLVLKFENEENTCPYSANLLGSCGSFQFWRHSTGTLQTWFSKLLSSRLERFQFNSQESWVKTGCSHSGNKVWVAYCEKTEVQGDTFCKRGSHFAKMMSHLD